MTEMIKWPEPKHIWNKSGTTPNPERINFIYDEIKYELMAGEVLELVERLVADYADEGLYVGQNNVK